MNIDRHNYEEYFLLYIDNELNVEQKKQVELFVLENPDLEEELVMLKHSRLIPDDSIVFDKKHLLMKEENASGNHSFINLNNYEQWLIMYVDDELNAEEKVAVEKFAKTHQHVQHELELFLQTKLPAEELVFPNKEALYKQEKAVRVISMQWWRVAVAAVLIISAGITVYSVLINKNNNGTNKEITKTTAEKKQVPSVNPGVPAKQDPNVISGQQPNEQASVSIPPRKQSNEKEKAQEQTEKENNQQLAYNPPNENVIDEQQATTVEIDKASIEEPKMKDNIAFEMPKENFNTGTVTPGDPKPPYDGPTSQGEGTENKKFRGFFRKATRILERTTSINAADDDKVLIGGMAINLK
jgi:hypothetical protein